MKKFAAIIAIIIVSIIAAITILSFTYEKSAGQNAAYLPDNTNINGVDCSGLSYKEAEDKLTSEWNSRQIKVTCNLNVQSDDFTDFGYEYEIEESLASAMSSCTVRAALNHYLNLPLKIQMPMVVKTYDNDFKQKVLDSPVFNMKYAEKSRDAYVDLSDPTFPIIDHVYGNEPDMDQVFADLTESISNGDLIFVFDERKYFSFPKVTSDDPQLLEYQQFCQKYLHQEITYELGKETFTIDPKTLSSLMKDDLSGKADKSAVRKYVSELADKYDNINTTREFKSLAGKDVSVPPGTYGWMIDQEAEISQLIKDIESHKNTSREPVFWQTGYGEYTRDMGDTYIDVDISKQTVKYFKEGELIFSSPCVTGSRLTGTVTDVGAYYILNKVRNVVLKGENADGSEYENFVSYWLGVNWSGEGFHDATWRSTFGGDIWTYNGSHGCINMPPSNMPDLYEKAEVDIPVAVHY